MAEAKTRPTTASVDAFLKAVDDEQQRADSFAVLELMKEITGLDPKMWGPSMVGFGEFHYEYASGHQGDMFRTGFSPRKGNITLYFASGLEQRFAKELKQLGKHKASKSCLHIKKLADVDLAVLRQMLEQNFAYLNALTPGDVKQASISRRRKQPANKPQAAKKSKPAAKKTTPAPKARKKKG
jgi:hypothetical protein